MDLIIGVPKGNIAYARGDTFATLVLHLLDDEVHGLFAGIGDRYVQGDLTLGLQNFTHRLFYTHNLVIDGFQLAKVRNTRLVFSF